MNADEDHPVLVAIGWIAIVGLLMFFAVALMLSGLFDGEDCLAEVARAPSPDQHGYEVHLVPAKGAWSDDTWAASIYDATRNDEAFGANLRWTGPRALAVEYLRGHEKQGATDLGSASESIHVSLVSGVLDPKAPPGAMDYDPRLQTCRPSTML